MTAVAGEHIPLTRHRLAQRLRAAVLGPRGGGTTRRRASDAFRLGLAIVVVAVSIPVMRANSAAELAIVRALNPPRAAVAPAGGVSAECARRPQRSCAPPAERPWTPVFSAARDSGR